MAPKCSTSMNICALRVTRLDPTTGVLAPGPNNSYVTSKLMSLAFDGEYDEGDSRVKRAGCDCIVVQAKAVDILLRWNLTLTMAQREPALEEMLTGGALITDNAVPANPIGVNFPAGVACGANPPAVAIEAWTKAWVGDSQRSDSPWIRWVWLNSIWRVGGGTLEADFQEPSFTGTSKSNPALNLNGIYHDIPAGVVLTPQGGWFHDTTHPADTSCSYATASST